jgi:hypothetical protein
LCWFLVELFPGCVALDRSLALSAGGNRAKRPPPGHPLPPTMPLLCLLVRPGMSGQGVQVHGGDRDFSIPRALQPPKHQPRGEGRGWVCRTKMPHPSSLHMPSVGTGVGWKLGHPLSLGAGLQGGGWGKGRRGSSNFPLGCCLYPSDELALGFIAFSPGQVCQGRLAGFWLASARLQSAFKALALLGLGTRRNGGRRKTLSDLLLESVGPMAAR